MSDSVFSKYFDYDQTATDWLAAVDPLLGQAILRMGRVERQVIPDLFAALIHAIIGQQVSAKAANTVWLRLQLKLAAITPEAIAKTELETIQQCGMTTRKAGYIKQIAQGVLEQSINLAELHQLPDERVIKQLSSLNGIGVWTAEMLLLNAMERPDIVSWGDIAIRRGMMKLYGLTELSRELFEQYKKSYSPYGSVASIYLWQISFSE